RDLAGSAIRATRGTLGARTGRATATAPAPRLRAVRRSASARWRALAVPRFGSERPRPAHRYRLGDRHSRRRGGGDADLFQRSPGTGRPARPRRLVSIVRDWNRGPGSVAAVPGDAGGGRRPLGTGRGDRAFSRVHLPSGRFRHRPAPSIEPAVVPPLLRV